MGSLDLSYGKGLAMMMKIDCLLFVRLYQRVGNGKKMAVVQAFADGKWGKERITDHHPLRTMLVDKLALTDGDVSILYTENKLLLLCLRVSPSPPLCSRSLSFREMI